MTGAEKILEELKTPEGKAKIQYWAEIKEQKKKALIASNDYILWLEKFTKDNLRFYNDDWLFCPEKISKEDLENVERLYLFYSIIEDYAKANFIYPTPTEYGNYYSVSYNNIGYLIGILVRQGMPSSCERTTAGDDFIKFEDIQSNKKQERTDLIKQKLESLSNLINTMIEEEIPVEAIAETTEKAILKIKKRKK